MGLQVVSGVRGQMKAVSLPIWQELLVGIEIFYLRISPVYWGQCIPHGDGSGVVVIPGFLATDLYLAEFRAWLRRIGYEAFDSGIGRNAECPNLLLRTHLNETIERAYKTTGKRVHLIGHSLGGVLARAAAAQMPSRIASVITLGSPFRGVAVHPSIGYAAELVRRQIQKRHSECVLPDCYTTACTCDFLGSLEVKLPKSMRQTAVYTKSDGIVDWNVCMTGHRGSDFEVSATHVGMAFNPIVYRIVAHRLAGKKFSWREVRVAKHVPRCACGPAR